MSKKAKGFKEPPFFKPGEMYYFDKGTNGLSLCYLIVYLSSYEPSIKGR